MGTISNTVAASALSVLTAPGAPLSSVSSLVTPSVIDSASPTDLASISDEASTLSETNQLFQSTTTDLFQTAGEVSSYNPTLSLVDAAYGFSPTTSSSTTPDLLQEGLANLYGASSNSSSSNSSSSNSSSSSSATSSSSTASPLTLNQSLLSLYGNNTDNNGNLINTTG